MKKILFCVVMIGLSAHVMAAMKPQQQPFEPASALADVKDWLPCEFRQLGTQIHEPTFVNSPGRIGFVENVQGTKAPIAAAIKNREGHSDSQIDFKKVHVLLSDEKLNVFAKKTVGKSIDQNIYLVTDKQNGQPLKEWACSVKDIQETARLRLNENLNSANLYLDNNQQSLLVKSSVHARLELTWLGKVVVFLKNGDKSQTFDVSEKALTLLQTHLELSQGGIVISAQKPQQASPGNYTGGQTPIAHDFFIHKSNASVIKSQPRYVFWRNIFVGGTASLLAALVAAYAYFHSK